MADTPTHPTLPDPNAATALLAVSAQLALGNDQWIDLRCKVSDLIRVGTDTTRTLANISAVQVLATLSGEASPITLSYDAAWGQGGSGPDVGETGAPYVYCYRYRSSLTGALSNASPPSRGGVMPRRQEVVLTGTLSTDAQVDLIDWFGFGGNLTGWTYLGTTPNSGTPTFTVAVTDANVDGGERLRFDCFQPWAVSDLPRAGTCSVAGTAVRWVSGATFNTNWAPGTPLVVNGVATAIYAVASSTLLHVTTNCGSGTGVAFSIKEPLLVGQALPAIFGGLVNQVWFTFGVGNPNDPGALVWTHGNDPDATSDANWLPVTDGSEPLQHGAFWNAVPWVFSTEDLYRIVAQFGAVNVFRAERTPCGRGLWSRWAFCTGPDGIYFLGKDGIYVTAGGPAVSITDPDLKVIFPRDGAAGTAMNGVDPPDMTQTAYLRLAYIDGYVYFDHMTTAGAGQTLIYEVAAQRWWLDRYGQPVRSRTSEPGAQVHDHLIGASGGTLAQYLETQLTDNGSQIDWAVHTPWVDGGLPRVQKLFGDVSLDFDPNGSPNGLTITPVYDNANNTLPIIPAVGINRTIREPYTLPLNLADGVDARNLGLQIAGAMTAAATARPKLYAWEPSYLLKADQTARRATDWDDCGYAGAKFIQGVILRANTQNAPKAIIVEGDGVPQLTFTATHNGEIQAAYPLAATGWAPFIAELVRLGGGDDTPWQFLDCRWVWEPAPEQATQWETQDTTHDLPGYFTVHDAVIGYAATAAVQWQLTYTDGATLILTLPSTGGAYARSYHRIPASKGRAVRYRWTSAQPFRLFKRDLSVRVQAWGGDGGWIVAQPFGGPSRVDGAAV